MRRAASCEPTLSLSLTSSPARISHHPTANDRLRGEGHGKVEQESSSKSNPLPVTSPGLHNYRDHHHSGVGVDFPFFPLSRLVGIFAPSDVMPEHLGRTDGQGNQSVVSALNRVGKTMVPDDYPVRHEILVSAYA
jgi:hypothetical protein